MQNVQVVLSVALVGRNVAETTVMASTMVLLNMFAPKSSIGAINGAGQTLMNLGEPSLSLYSQDTASPAQTTDAFSLSLPACHSIWLREGKHSGSNANISSPQAYGNTRAAKVLQWAAA